ncbi:MAG: winged helix DNA-binding protein [Alphaproteobacteria bacterium]|nr:MAG: winged helix DNA-binding protein [Alphaproteobacteria bacterium]
MRTQTVGGVRPAGVEAGREQIKHRYLEALTLIDLFNIGDSELTAGELKTRGHYQGSNVSYNLKKLVEAGYVNHERSNSDKRSVRVRLTPRGQAIRERVDQLYNRQLHSVEEVVGLSVDEFERINKALTRLERFWTDQILYRL